MTIYSVEYYEEKRGRLQAILFEIAPDIHSATYDFVMEMLHANELGVSLEVMVESLVEAGAPITSKVRAALTQLAEEMHMDYDVTDPLSKIVETKGFK